MSKLSDLLSAAKALAPVMTPRATGSSVKDQPATYRADAKRAHHWKLELTANACGPVNGRGMVGRRNPQTDVAASAKLQDAAGMAVQNVAIYSGHDAECKPLDVMTATGCNSHNGKTASELYYRGCDGKLYAFTNGTKLDADDRPLTDKLYKALAPIMAQGGFKNW